MSQLPESTRPLDALASLRTATASRHLLLDSGLPVGADDARLHDYIAHVSMLRAWLAPLAAWLDRFDDGPQADARLGMRDSLRARLALIDADLLDAGIDPASIPAAPDAAWPAHASAAWRWGACYVIEGSQLGGTVLYQRLHARLAPHPLCYLKGDAAGPGPRWRLFMQAVRAHVRSPAEIADACAGACEAFDRILAVGAHVRPA